MASASATGRLYPHTPMAEIEILGKLEHFYSGEID
jgi:hypothetical protein